jgi:hypothetical protein
MRLARISFVAIGARRIDKCAYSANPDMAGPHLHRRRTTVKRIGPNEYRSQQTRHLLCARNPLDRLKAGQGGK